MKKLFLILLTIIPFLFVSCDKKEHMHDENCQMCTDTDGDGVIDCTCSHG